MSHGKHASTEMVVASPISCRAAGAWPLHARVQAWIHLLLHGGCSCSGLAEACPGPQPHRLPQPGRTCELSARVVAHGVQACSVC